MQPFPIAIDPQRALRPAALYHRFAGCAEPQPAFFDFYPYEGYFSCLYYKFAVTHAELRANVPYAQQSGMLLRFPAPAAAATSALLTLLRDARFQRLARCVRAGCSFHKDITHYSAEAVAAVEQMRDMVADHFAEPTANLVQLLTPADIITDNGDIQQGTSDAMLEAWAATYASMAWTMYRCVFQCDEDVMTHLRAIRASHTSNA
jgi:hypothetical protein